MAQYTWLTYGAAKSQLAARLADPNFQFWTAAECGLYIIESLRVWNAFTEVWNTEFSFTAVPESTWYDLSALNGSPRLRSLKDSDLYTMMQYHLLEPPTGGGTWAGTSQFSLADLQQSLQRRRDEMIQITGCNIAQLDKFDLVGGNYRAYLPDNVLEPRRIRFLPSFPYGNPITLAREDRYAFDVFEPAHMQSPGLPSSWGIVAGPPLAFDLDVVPNIPGQFDVIAIRTGTTFAPPTQSLMNVPDDWAWVCKWGAMADLLSRESEATDRVRAQFCLQRYQDGLKVMLGSNWLVQGEIDGVPVDTPSLAEMDTFSTDWEFLESWSFVVVAGMDLVAACPVAQEGQNRGVTVNLVGNAPVPAVDGDYVQVARDVWEAVLAYAQALAMFKQGGQEFLDSQQMLAEFALAATAQNKRLLNMGIFTDVLKAQSQREDAAQPR